MTTPTEVQVTTPETGPETPVENARPDNVPEKFWDAEKGEVRTEALLQSYTELEKKGAKAEETPPAEETPEQEAEAAKALAKEYGLPESVASFAKKFADTGELGMEDYAELEKLGFSKAVVDQFISGAITPANADDPNAGFIETAGDAETMNKIATWAAENFSEDDIKKFNEASAKGDDEAQEMFKVMAAEYEKAEGKTPARRVTGDPETTTSDVYTSMDELHRDQADPRYSTDKVFRDQVLAKAKRSTKL